MVNDFSDLVAPLADYWTCDVCGNENHSSENCDQCGNKAGAWKCPKCGKIIKGTKDYAAIEICICPKCYWDIVDEEFKNKEEYDEMYGHY